MKTARIGTIMPWGGDGFSGFGPGNRPAGWELCDGSTRDAAEFPLLASIVGNTYGGSFTGDFPDYVGDFVLPNISNRAMVDLEKEYLGLVDYQAGQTNVLNTVIDSNGTKFGDLVSDFGTTQVIKTVWSANADIDFTLPAGLTLTGKYTTLGITDPDFQTSITTLNRKLGINHTPAHPHVDSIASVSASFIGPAPFTSAQVQASGNTEHPNCSSVVSRNHTCDLLPSAQEAPSWQNGRTLVAYYGDEQYEHTIPFMDKFQDFVNDSGKDYWSQVPAPDWHDGTPTRNSPQAPNQSYNFVDVGGFTSTTPVTEPEKSHAIPAWSGLIPKPMIFGSRRNFFGKNTGSTYNAVTDNPEDPALYFTIGNVSVPNGVTEFTLPVGTDIRTEYTEGDVTYYQYDRIHPWQMVDAECFAKGSYIVQITREGDNDSNYVYTIELNLPTIAGGTYNVTFKEGTFATTMNTVGNNDENATSFISHNHGSFDLTMGKGSLNPPATHPVPTISIGDVNPDNLNDALNIIVDTSQPALNVVYLIKAY